MASKTETAMDAEPDPKPQNETTPDSNSLSSTTKTSSESTACTISSDSKPLTLSSTSNNTQLGYPSFSKLLEGVMAANSTVSSHKNVRFQGQFGMSHQEALATVTAKAAQSQQLQAKSTEFSIDLPRNKQPESSVPSSSSVLHKEKPLLQTTYHIQKQNGKNSSDHASENSPSPPHKPLSVQLFKEKVDKHGNTWLSKEQTDDIPKTPNSDGYCWRKYGQKQVKNSGSSRSYYRCTYLNCSAKKKVQHLDGSGRIIAVVYKADHNHEPPKYLKVSSRKRDASSTSQVNDPGDRAQKLDDPHTPTSEFRKEVEQAVVPIRLECRDSSLRSSACISKGDAREEPVATSYPIQRIESEKVTLPPETEHCKSSKSNEVVISDSMKEFDVVPLKKRRIKEGSKACSESVYRTFKEPKVVVHAAGGVESLSDGYRWRKYGQKMVKGNPNPRSYYRCSSAGCPVRKHVERATDNSTTVIVTYEGTHDHDKPVPKKCHGSPKSPALVAATTTLVQKSEAKSPPASQEPSQGSRDADSDLGEEKATEAGSDKVLESARTLLSIGIELKSC